MAGQPGLPLQASQPLKRDFCETDDNTPCANVPFAFNSAVSYSPVHANGNGINHWEATYYMTHGHPYDEQQHNAAYDATMGAVPRSCVAYPPQAILLMPVMEPCVWHGNYCADQQPDTMAMIPSQAPQPAPSLNVCVPPPPQHVPKLPLQLTGLLVPPLDTPAAEMGQQVVQQGSASPVTSTEMEASPEIGETTLMVRNVPTHVTPNCLVKELDRCGFEGSYNFVYLPQACNANEHKGFAFINFTDPCMAGILVGCWHRRSRFGSKQAQLNICPADIQGLRANLEKWVKNPSLQRIKNPNFWPLVLDQRSQTLQSLCGKDVIPTVSAMCAETHQRASGAAETIPFI